MNVGRYPWIVSRPVRRELPPTKPSRLAVLVCGRCGWESRGRRKKCPACMCRLDQQEQAVSGVGS
jgi:hypothetical protein